MLKDFRKKAYTTLEPKEETTSLSKTIDLSISTLILLSVISVILESIPAVESKYGNYFSYFHLFTISIFTIEYLLRVWVAIENEKFSDNPFKARISYIFSPLGILDLLAILPFYIPVSIGVDFRFMKLFRLLRVFRLFELFQYNREINVFINVFRNKRKDLILGSTFILLLLLFVSTLMYFAEHEAQPEKFSSILDAMWWGVATITTVGYGDITPITAIGKLLGGITAVFGFALFAVPAGILASGFSEEMQQARKDKNSSSQKDACPHCGKSLQEEGHQH